MPFFSGKLGWLGALSVGWVFIVPWPVHAQGPCQLPAGWPAQVCPPSPTAPTPPRQSSTTTPPTRESTPPPKEPTPPPPSDPTPAASDSSTPDTTSTGESSEGLSITDSSVGYIDSAIPGTLLRLRYDTAYRNNRPTRAEFFYPRGAPLGPGLPMPETNIDYQELMTYAELALVPNFSLFVDVPVRFLNPTINANESGLGDMNAGFKWAMLRTSDTVASVEFKTYAPTGDSLKGLGNNHVSLEPALLFYQRLSDRLTLESELRYWIPVGGTDFAGTVLRYGVGFSYGQRPPDRLWLTPVVEFVGWTVLDGKEAVTDVPGITTVKDAAGDTIVNVKAGLRLGLGNAADIYAGYGRALTGDVWYKDIWRFELRFLF